MKTVALKFVDTIPERGNVLQHPGTHNETRYQRMGRLLTEREKQWALIGVSKTPTAAGVRAYYARQVLGRKFEVVSRGNEVYARFKGT